MLTLIQSHPASNGPHPGAGRHVGVTVINFNTSAETLRCIASLGACTEPPAWIEVLDNASHPDDCANLQSFLPTLPHSHIRLHRSESNLGFAAGSNRLCEHLLQEPDCQYIGLLNNDAVAQTNWVSELVPLLLPASPQPGMAGGRMHKLSDPEQVDTLGITLYASLMPADRHSTADPFLGPTGGCCLMTRAFVEDIVQTTGYLFDERYFCYCEDTDLAVRANLLGYRPAYTDRLIALHQGQASSGDEFNAFIAYQGLRNSLWMQAKLIPAPIFLKHSYWLVLAHLMSIARHSLSGQPSLLWRVYRDAWKSRKAIQAERKAIALQSRISPIVLEQSFSKRFYRAGYVKLVLSQMAKKVSSALNAKSGT
jgi:GT2 family glycosyltransferase